MCFSNFDLFVRSQNKGCLFIKSDTEEGLQMFSYVLIPIHPQLYVRCHETPLNSKLFYIAISNRHVFSTPILLSTWNLLTRLCVIAVPKLQNIAILLYSAIFLTLFRHRWCILWDDIPPSVPDDIWAPQAPEALTALHSSRLWLQAPQAMKPHVWGY